MEKQEFIDAWAEIAKLWHRGKVEINNKMYFYCAKVYDEGSIYGIKGGRISKLSITNEDKKEVLNYDRGWDIRPKNPEVKKVYQQLLKEFK